MDFSEVVGEQIKEMNLDMEMTHIFQEMLDGASMLSQMLEGKV